MSGLLFPVMCDAVYFDSYQSREEIYFPQFALKMEVIFPSETWEGLPICQNKRLHIQRRGIL